jgi:hypothetical protein
MGKSTQEQKTQSSTGPWGATQPALKDLVSGIEGTNLGANPYAGRIGMLADDLFTGGPDRYSDYQKAMQPIASGQSLDVMNNPVFKNYLDTVSGDARKSVNDQFASMGRTTSPAHAQALGRGISEGTAPAFFGAYENERGRQLGAIGDLFTGGQAADSASLQRRLSGIDVANVNQALPLQNAELKSKLLLPIASLGSEGQSTTTQTNKANPYQLATGAALGGLGLLGGNPMFSAGLLGQQAMQQKPLQFSNNGSYYPW